MRKLLNNPTLLSLGMNGGSALLGLLSFAFISRVLEANAFGEWVLLLTVYSMLDLIRNGIVQNAFIKQLASTRGANKTGVYGAALQVNVQVSTGLSVLCTAAWLALLLSDWWIEYQSYLLMLALWMMLSALYQFTQWAILAFSNFQRLAILRLIQPALFLLLIVVYHEHITDVVRLALLYAAALGVGSFWALVSGWLWVKTWKRGNRQLRRKIREFGKYSMGTMLASHLLRSSDTFLIGWLMGTSAVGIYAVAFKFIELLEMPLRSFVQVFIPKMAKLSEKSGEAAAKLYISYGKVLSIGFLPVIAAMVLFPELLVKLIGGEGFLASALVLQALAIFTAVLPFDRLSGVSLDMINKPQLNLVKVLIMLTVNIVGDCIAILYFDSLVGVALVSTATFLTGLLFGNAILRKHLPIKYWHLLRLNHLSNDLKTVFSK